MTSKVNPTGLVKFFVKKAKDGTKLTRRAPNAEPRRAPISIKAMK